MSLRQDLRRHLLPAVLVPLFLASCTSTGEPIWTSETWTEFTSRNPTKPTREFTEVRGSDDLLARAQPADVALVPIRNQTEREDVPLELFREAFATELVDRLYSPLDFTYVDGNWVESSFGGTPAPDALMVVTITGWDPGRLYSTGAVEVTGELLLVEGGSTTGTPLWGLSLHRSIDLGDGRGNPPAPAGHHIGEAVRTFAREALALLPERDPVQAHL